MIVLPFQRQARALVEFICISHQVHQFHPQPGPAAGRSERGTTFSFSEKHILDPECGGFQRAPVRGAWESKARDDARWPVTSKCTQASRTPAFQLTEANPVSTRRLTLEIIVEAVFSM